MKQNRWYIQPNSDMMGLRKILLSIVLVAMSISVAEAKRAQKVEKSDSITIFGRVLCEGEPLAGVPVSDGVHIVKTDSLGRYAIASHKFQNTVFVITPSGYEPECRKRILPNFWHRLEKKRVEAEQHDFHLVKRDQRNHRIIFVSGPVFQNSNEDLMQFKKRSIPAVRNILKDTPDSTAVYSVVMGDISNNSLWYSRDFDVGDAVSLMATMRYPTMIYTVMGDADHDGAVPGTGLTDYKSERHYVYTCGPKYYSMNIGDVHYIVLDNSVFRNEPGKGRYPAEIVGKRNYDRFVTADQLDWLRRDLKLVEDKEKPVVVLLHNTVFTATGKHRISKRFTKPEDVDSLTNCFADYKNVHFFTSSNWARRLSYTKELPHIVEHSLASVSGNRWGLGNMGYESISTTGVPGGFEVFDAKGCELSWQYISDRNSDKPFRVYDMASVGHYYRETLEVQNLLREYPKTFINYGAKDMAKYVYINWWGFEKGAKLEVFEDNRPLRVRQIYQADPQYVVTSPAITLKNNRSKHRFSRNNCAHMFRVQRSSHESVIRVRTTDPFGRIHEEQFVGTKKFAPMAK